MNSLDDLFTDALDRAAMPTTQERRGAVAEVTVHGARRRRRVRTALQGVAGVAVVGVVAFVGSLAMGSDPVPPASPAPVPSDPAPSVTPSVNLDYASVVDERFPAAPTMTEADWAEVTPEWDAELASFVGGGRDGYGSIVAIYVTPPGGDRMLAYATADTPMVGPFMLTLDLSARTALLNDMGDLYTVDLLTGAVSEFIPEGAGRLYNASALGRVSNGDSLYSVTLIDEAESLVTTIYRVSDGVTTLIWTGSGVAGPVWGDHFVMEDYGRLYAVDADGQIWGDFSDLGGCWFIAWSTDGTFTALCGASDGAPGEYVQVNPATGAKTDIGTDKEPELRAVDTVREWRGLPFQGLPGEPPLVYNDGVLVADLSDGFADNIKSYSMIFGARPAS